MTAQVLGESFDELTDIQRTAVKWSEGPLLVLAGPGSGKTRVLTGRIARLLESSMDERFRVLALTFTNRAANEMSSRVSKLAPDLHGRANICTFHRFCEQVLRQHGVHLAIKPDFAIYSQVEDRRSILKDALVRDGQRESASTSQWLLTVIDRLKEQLVEPKDATQRIAATNGGLAEQAELVARAYQLYEDELRRINALDFHSLILEANRLFGYAVLAGISRGPIHTGWSMNSRTPMALSISFSSPWRLADSATCSPLPTTIRLFSNGTVRMLVESASSWRTLAARRFSSRQTSDVRQVSSRLRTAWPCTTRGESKTSSQVPRDG